MKEENKWTNFYRDAVDYLGNKLGKHEVKSLKLNENEGAISNYKTPSFDLFS